MPQNTFEDQSTLVQVMVWCRQATSHYLSQCWLRSMSPYGISRPQWVNTKMELQQNTLELCLCVDHRYQNSKQHAVCGTLSKTWWSGVGILRVMFEENNRWWIVELTMNWIRKPCTDKHWCFNFSYVQCVLNPMNSIITAKVMNQI